MNPEKNQYVKIIFKNGFNAEGIVESWTDQKSVLKSIDGNSFLIIQRTLEDIMVIKVFLQDPTLNRKIEIKTKLDEKFKETYNEPSDDNLRVKKLADLRIMMAEQEKKIIADQLKDHTISETRKAEYGLPGFFKKQGS